MDKVLDQYLEKMEKYLKPAAASERTDIIKEIQSEMQELQGNGISSEQIVERLGSPKELAKAYLGDMLSTESRFSWNRFLIVCAFYSLVGFSGMVVIPCLAVIAPVFVFCGIAAPILAGVKMIDYLFDFGIPYVENIGIFLGGLVTFNPIVEFFIALIFGVLLALTGRGAWRLLVLYCKKVGKTARDLSIGGGNKV